MKKLLISIVVIVVLGALCAGVLTIVGGAGAFYWLAGAQSDYEAQALAIEEQLRVEEEALVKEAEAALEAELAALEEAAAKEAELADEEEALDEEAEAEAEEQPGSDQATASSTPAYRPRTRTVTPEPEPEPEITADEDELFDEEEELNLDDLDDLLEDDDPLGEIEILDDEPEEKRGRKRRNKK